MLDAFRYNRFAEVVFSEKSPFLFQLPKKYKPEALVSELLTQFSKVKNANL